MKRFDCILCATVLILLSAPAQAYVGPGPGLSMLGSLFTLIGGVFVALFMVLLYPIRVLIKRAKGERKKPDDTKTNG